MNMLKVNGNLGINLDLVASISLNDEKIDVPKNNYRPEAAYNYVLSVQYIGDDHSTRYPLNVSGRNETEHNAIMNYAQTKFIDDIQKGGLIDMTELLRHARTLGELAQQFEPASESSDGV